MERIETLPDGTRQRWGPGKGHFNHACDDGCICDTGPWLLPRIPNWPPALGPAPQFIAKPNGLDRIAVFDGDTYAKDICGDGQSWLIYIARNPVADGLTVPQMLTGVYLIARADSTKDA